MATIRKKNKGYQIRVSLGSNHTGDRIVRYMTWIPPEGMSEKKREKEVQLVAAEFELKCRSGEIVDDNIRFYDFAEIWFRDYARKQLRPHTLQRYESLMPRINAAIGQIKLKDLRPHHLLEFYNNLEEDGIRRDTKYRSTVDLEAVLSKKGIKKTTLAENANVSVCTIRSACQGKNIATESAAGICKALDMPIDELFSAVEGRQTLSNATIQYHHRLISSILSTAEEWEAIKSNPCRKVKPPKVTRSAPKYLDDEQAVRFLGAIQTEPPKYRAIGVLLILTGMRRGEALGLEWKDIDFDHEVINIRRTSQYVEGYGIITDETKNNSSARAIKAPSSLMAELRKYKAYQTEERLKVGDRWHDTGRLFTQWDGKPMNPDSVNTWMRGFLKRAELPEITPHSLRHTNATLQIANNVPLTTVAGRLGHATPATTTKIYSHEIKSADAAAAEMLDDLLHPIKAVRS